MLYCIITLYSTIQSCNCTDAEIGNILTTPKINEKRFHIQFKDIESHDEISATQNLPEGTRDKYLIS